MLDEVVKSILLGDFSFKIKIEPSKSLFDSEKQKGVFGGLNKEGLKIPFQNGQPTPIFTGLFKEYEKYINSNKQYIILLGASGTSKTFILQQEAQKCYMIYILCNDGQTNSGERDASFTQLRTYLSTMESLKEDKKLVLIQIFMITRLLYLKLALEKAKNKGDVLKPFEFFLMQVNGQSENLKNLFIKLKGWDGFFSDPTKASDFLSSLMNDIKEYSSVRDFGLCFAIDEAGVANQLCKNE